MGYYIETGTNFGKAKIIKERYNATECSEEEFIQLDPSTEGLVIVVDNGDFEAAAFCYNYNELERFTEDPFDPRPKTYLKMNRALAARLSRCPV